MEPSTEPRMVGSTTAPGKAEDVASSTACPLVLAHLSKRLFPPGRERRPSPAKRAPRSESWGTPATAVTLSGTTYLTATVPADALTGSVTVTTGATALTSTKTFKVLPTITSIPASGSVGTPVVIDGTGLTQT